MAGKNLLSMTTNLLLCSPFLAAHLTHAFTTTAPIAGLQSRATNAPATTSAVLGHKGTSRRRPDYEAAQAQRRRVFDDTTRMMSSPAEEAATIVGADGDSGVKKVDVDPYMTDLPDSFEDSIVRMGKGTLQAMDEGHKLLRVDFDTSAGDETYTTLKSSLEMAKQFTKLLAEELICDKERKEPTGSTMTIFFPDAGSAALAKFEWGAGTDAAELPAGVRFCTVKTDEPADTDVGCILLCPRNSEADFALELLKKVETRGQFMVLINPALINMGTTGYGLAGRRIRDEIISTFYTSYYLRTLPWGAVSKEHGKRYTVWQDDADDPTGYRLLKIVAERPVGEALDDIYNIANGLQEEDETPEFLNTVAKFVRDFGNL